MPTDAIQRPSPLHRRNVHKPKATTMMQANHIRAKMNTAWLKNGGPCRI
jgi:hypothetical protein